MTARESQQTIKFQKTMSTLEGEAAAYQIDILTAEDLTVFKTILHRALSTWPDCPARWKEFADIVIHGGPLQTYVDLPMTGAVQEIPETLIIGRIPVCSICGGKGMSHVWDKSGNPCDNDPYRKR
jgi:hypothetical protein